MVLKYLTIKDVANATITEKRSQFIANMMPITDEDDAIKKISEIKKIYRDAKHNVYAFRTINNIEKFNDDGEPSGTAGKPILDILKGENLQNILVVVTRYFGGILLGTGGLVRAYSDAVKEARKKANITEMILCDIHKVMINYSYFDIIQHYCNNNNFKILSSEFLEKVESNILVPNEKYNEFINKISDLTDRSACMEVLKTAYFTDFELE
jgi:uncharacterized YigZ family protein